MEKARNSPKIKRAGREKPRRPFNFKQANRPSARAPAFIAQYPARSPSCGGKLASANLPNQSHQFSNSFEA